MQRMSRLGFTIIELLVVIALIAVLLGMLLPALNAVRSNALMTKSMSNMRQIGTWMRMYSGDNRETIVPSQFDYSNEEYPGKVRSVVTIGDLHQGTWADVLWTVFEPAISLDGLQELGNDYRYDSPDHALYDAMGGTLVNPLRSAANNSRNFDRSGVPRPYGAGANELGKPGYFAANNFFNAVPSPDNRWFVTGQIRRPEKSMYLVDSVAGEVIEDEELPYDLNPGGGGPGIGGSSTGTLEVDYRYAGDVCLMLMLDGHIESVGRFADLVELEGDPSSGIKGRQIRVRDLDQR